MQDTNAPKKTWQKPQLTTYGTVEELTGDVVKTLGFADGIIFDIDGSGPVPGVPIGSGS